MTFWPDDLDADEVRSPRDIMDEAGEELENRTGKLTVVIQESRLDDRVVLAFEVTQRERQVALNLFEASHRLDQSYPVVIDPPASDIPEFLKKQRYEPAESGSLTFTGGLSMQHMAAMQRMVGGTPGRYVENEWVCATPTEFKDKLTELFSEDYVKVRIISLLAPIRSEEVSDAETGDTSEDSTGAEHEQDN